MCFSPHVGFFWGGETGLVHNLLRSFTLDSSKSEVFEMYFLDIVIT